MKNGILHILLIVILCLFAALPALSQQDVPEEAAKHFKDNKLSNMYFVLNSVNLNTIAYRYGYGKKYGYGYA